MNITVDYTGELSAVEVIFEASGAYSGIDVDFASGFTNLANRVNQDLGSGKYRLAAMKTTDGLDACVDFTGGVVVGEITFITSDTCMGIIDVIGSSVAAGSIITNLVGCDPVAAVASTVISGSITIVNNPPSITCPDDMTVEWGDVIEFDVVYSDPDNCETSSFFVTDGPGAIDNDGHYIWATSGDDVCDHTVTLKITDKCGAFDECSFDICVHNTPPTITDMTDTICVVWGVTLSGQVEAEDDPGPPPHPGPNLMTYTIPTGSFTGPGDMSIDGNGAWSWTILDDPDYLGNFDLTVVVSDGADTCYPCSPHNADTTVIHIHVIGFPVTLETVNGAYQGHDTTVAISVDPNYMPSVFCCDYIGGFDFLVAYDASALTALEAIPGDGIVDGEDGFEYFTYRFGPFGNCGNACPTGMMRIVGMREYNNGILNDFHMEGPGDLAYIRFLVSNDRNLECQFVPIRFFWYDCGDNTLSDESGNFLHLGRRVLDWDGTELNLIFQDTSALNYGFFVPDDSCYDTVFNADSVFKNAPIGSIIFRNGGIRILCREEIDAGGDVNLNGLANEIADAVVFTNYFIKGLAAFTINVEGQTAATEINGDGFVLTVADLVYLIRIIVGDANAIPKATPNAFADFKMAGNELKVETNVDMGAALFVFDGQIDPILATDAAHMELVYGHDGNTTRALVYSLDAGRAITNGNILVDISGATLVSVEAAEYNGTTIANTTAKLIPTEFALRQNYPNPFNPSTGIELALPQASDWNIGIFNVAGQKVAEFSGFSEAGTVKVNWNADNMASGMYFYRATAGDFTDAKKMLLIK